MKIDSTDASSVSYQKTQEPKKSTIDIKPITNDIKPITNDIKSITNDIRQSESDLDSYTDSQKKPMDKNELPVSEKVLSDAIEKANKAIIGGNRRLEFSIHDETNQIMVKVLDSDTGDIIREIPREKSLDNLAKLWELAGIIVDERR